MAITLVTGATGFLGSHITRQLIENGHHVRILRRESSQLDALQGLPVEHLIGDLFDVNQLTDYLSGVDWVFHVAAVSNYWRSDKASIYRVNVDGTKNLLRAIKRAGVGRFLFTSSVAGVGYQEGKIATEESRTGIDPKISPYGHSKFLAEAEVLQAVKQGLDAVILNPAVILGPGDLNQISGSLVIEIKRGMLLAMPQTGGVNVIDVRDVAKAHLAAATKGRTGERYILGSVNITHKALARLICDVVGVRPPFLPAPGFIVPAAAWIVDMLRAAGVKFPAEGNQLRLSRRHIYVDASKMWAELHKPEIDIRQSIEDTYQWYKDNGVL
jgi:dihydroflavonol-4-reductase